MFDLFATVGVCYSVDGRVVMYEAQRENLYEGISASATTWEVASGRHISSIRSELMQRSATNQETLVSAFSPEGAAAFSYGGSADQVEIRASTGMSLTVAVPVTITALAFDPGGATLAIGDAGGAVRLVNTADGSEAQLIQAGGAVRGLFFSPDGTLLAVPRVDGSVPVWRVGDQAPLGTLAGSPGDRKVLFTADNQLAIVAGARGVAFYQLPGGALLATLPAQAEDIAIGPRRRLLAVLHDGRVVLWGVAQPR